MHTALLTTTSLVFVCLATAATVCSTCVCVWGGGGEGERVQSNKVLEALSLASGIVILHDTTIGLLLQVWQSFIITGMGYFLVEIHVIHSSFTAATILTSLR